MIDSQEVCMRTSEQRLSFGMCNYDPPEQFTKRSFFFMRFLLAAAEPNPWQAQCLTHAPAFGPSPNHPGPEKAARFGQFDGSFRIFLAQPVIPKVDSNSTWNSS